MIIYLFKVVQGVALGSWVSDLEGAHKDDQVQLLASVNTNPKSLLETACIQSSQNYLYSAKI